MSILWFLEIDIVMENAIGVLLIITLSMLINAIIYRSSLINKTTKEKLRILQTYLPIIEDIIEELKDKQHDYHNRVTNTYNL